MYFFAFSLQDSASWGSSGQPVPDVRCSYLPHLHPPRTLPTLLQPADDGWGARRCKEEDWRTSREDAGEVEEQVWGGWGRDNRPPCHPWRGQGPLRAPKLEMRCVGQIWGGNVQVWFIVIEQHQIQLEFILILIKPSVQNYFMVLLAGWGAKQVSWTPCIAGTSFRPPWLPSWSLTRWTWTEWCRSGQLPGLRVWEVARGSQNAIALGTAWTRGVNAGRMTGGAIADVTTKEVVPISMAWSNSWINMLRLKPGQPVHL